MAAVVTVTSARVMWGWTCSGTALATIDRHLTTSLDQAWSERGPAIRLGQARTVSRPTHIVGLGLFI